MKIVLVLLLLCNYYFVKCQRRITNGSLVAEDVNTGFVVYLVAAGRKVPVWPGWMCGGSIIHPAFIVTASACLYEVRNIYVISGYRKYVPRELLHTDECIKRTKRKIISYCTRLGARPNNMTAKRIQFRPYVVNGSDHDWTFNDLALARVRPIFDFYDKTYLMHCSYLPNAIKINYSGKYDKSGQDAVVYGWGHARYFRPDGDLNDYNEVFLRWASSKIVELNKCRERFPAQHFSKVRSTIKQLSICAYSAGNYDGSGAVVSLVKPEVHGCEEYRRAADLNNSRNANNCSSNVTFSDKIQSNHTYNLNNTRRNGICQNDHGSPLVTWIGGQIHLIGIGAFFMVKNDMQCSDPYVYTSTRPNSRFISCILEVNNSGNKSRRMMHRTKCDDDEAFKIVRKNLTEYDDNEELHDLDDFLDSSDRDELSDLAVLSDYDLE